MSKSEKRKSDEVPALPENHSVYDFLYHDARRIGSYLAQFEASGLLQSVKQTAAVEESEQSKAGATAGVSLLRLASTNGQFEDQTGSVSREAIEKQFDPFWTHAINLLTRLEEHGLIKRGLADAHIGQFVLTSGVLNIMDLSMFKALWSNPAIKRILDQNAKGQLQANFQNRTERRRTGRSGGSVGASRSEVSDESEAALALLGAVPHLIHAQMKTGTGEHVWGSLRDDGWVGASADLTLKHGVALGGTWNVLGVLDALPEFDAEGAVTAEALEHFTAADGLATAVITQAMSQMALPLRQLLGRPFNSYGITPLLIFREVAR